MAVGNTLKAVLWRGSGCGLVPFDDRTIAARDGGVDALTVRFGRDGAAEIHGRAHLSDVNADGRRDLVLHFATAATGIVAGDTSASLTGATFDGEAIEGGDAIVTVAR